MTAKEPVTYCANQAHQRLTKASARVSYPDGRFKPTTGCIGCMTWAIRDALDEGRPILVEPLTAWEITSSERVVVIPAHAAMIRAKAAAEIEAEYQRQAANGLAVGLAAVLPAIAARFEAHLLMLANGYDEIAYDGGMPGASKTGAGSPRALRADARFLRELAKDTSWITGGAR